MAIIKKFSPFLNLTNFQVFENDDLPNSEYFRISEFSETFTGGKNGFLIEGSEFLKETTEIKIEILDVEGNPIYFEPGGGVPEYYEGNSKLVSVHVYDDTPIGIGKITVLGELKKYIGNDGAIIDVPDEWKGVYNVKWERSFNINKNLNNESIVRFYKRPIVGITELVKPIFSKNITNVTETGEVSGFPMNPPQSFNISNWRAGTTYLLQRTSGSWDRDVDENTITISSLNYSPTIIEVLNDREVLVNIPFTDSNNLVESFSSQSYSVTYQDIQNQTIGESALTGSFGKIDITQLKTFVGDVARVKVFRKSRNAVGDFQFVQEAKLESTELLRDITTTKDTEISYGRFDSYNLSNYWVTSSNSHPTTINSSVLSQAVKIDYAGSGVQELITSQSISISKDVEYTLNFKTKVSGSVDSSNKKVRAYLSSSNFTQDFLSISGSDIYQSQQTLTKNIISENTGDAKLVFEVEGDDWYISNVSLRNAQDTSFSPDEFTIIQDIPRKTASETFDFKFEFYDVNNNYIPVDVIATKEFDGGNDFPSSTKLLTFESDRNAFRFSSGSVQNPKGQQIQFKIGTSNLTGSTTFASSAFDVDGNYLNPSDYTQYPGKLTTITPAGAIVTINNFTGSRTDSSETPFVGSVVYTASLENFEEFETVYRLEDGDNAPQLIVTSNANQFIYEPTTLSPKPSGQSITVRAQRKNLASLITPIEVNSGSNKPPLNFVETVNGIDSYTISSTQFSQSFASNNFDEVTYSFTGSDVFGNSQTDEITLSKVVNFDAVSLVLSNESTSFPANSTGEILGGFAASSGSVQMFIGSNQITHDDYDSDNSRNRNTFDIKTISGTNVTPTDTSPNTSNYSISAFQTSKDSGSLTLNIEYLAGDNTTSQSFEKIVSYTKSKKAVPNVLTKTSPTSQTINSGSSGYEVPQTIEVVVQEGGDEYGYQAGLSGGLSEAYKFEINSVSSGSNSNEIITPTYGTHDGYNGTIGSASIDYVNSEGTLVENKLVRFDVSVSKVGVDGTNARSVTLLISPNTIQYNADGTNPTPSTVTLIASGSSTINDPYYKFTGGDSSFVDDTTFNDSTGSQHTSRVFTAPTTIPSTPFTFRVGVSDNNVNLNNELDSDQESLIFTKPGLDTRPRFIIKPINGTQIKNNQGTLQLQVVRLDGTGSFDVSGSAQGDAQLYSGSTLLTTSMTGISDGGNGVTYNPVFSNTAISGSKLISLKEDDGTLLDTITLLDVTDGLGGGTFLANSLHTNRGLTNSFTPTTLPLTASFFDSNGTEFQKSALITPSFNGTVDKMKISTATGDSEITLTANDGDGGSITLGSATATTTKDLTVNATFIDPNTSKTTSVSETFFIVSDGRDGTSARSVRLTTDAQVFVEALDGTITPSSIAFTAIRQNISGSSTFNTDPSVTLTGAVDSRALSATNFGSNTSVVLSVTASEDGDFTDEVRIVRVKEGTDGLTLISSNPAHTLPASSSGEVLDYANSGTTLSLFEGATQLDYDASGTTAGHWTVATSQSPAGKITIGTITDSTNDAVVANHSAMDDSTDASAITYTITGKRLNGDAISLTSVQTIVKSKEGLDAVQVTNDNSNHTFTCNTSGTPVSFTGSGTNIQVFEGVTALTFTTSTVSAGKYSVSISNESGLTEGTASGNNTTTCVIGNHSAFTANQATITYTISGQRLDGTSFSLTTTQTLTKSIRGEDGTIGQDGANAVDITPSLFTQNLIRDINNGDTFDTVSNITITAQETGSALTAVLGSATLSNSQFKINSTITNGVEASAGVLTPSQPSSASNPGGLTTTYTIDYKDGSGNDGSKQFNHPITTAVVGTNGPGVVFTGVWESSRAYQFSTGASGRRDVVLWSSSGNSPYDEYYAVKSSHTSATGNVANGAPHQSSANKWESLGTQDFFVAAKIGLFEDSFVQNTLNVGSNNSGGISAANITLAGGTANPYISIGQSSTAGNQGYDVDGIFIGNHDNSGTPSYRMSLKGGTNHIKWDGSNLDIKGSITLTGGPAASSLNSLNTTTGSLNQSVSSLNTETGSINTAVSNAQSGVNAINSTSGALENPLTYAFGGSGFELATNTAAAGLNLTSQYMGYHDGSNFTTYMDSGGDFYLGGTSGALTWDASEAKLTVTGTINITGGQTANQLNSLNSATQSLAGSVSSLDGAVSQLESVTSSLANPTSYAFGGNAFTLATNTAAAGLNLTSEFLGYHDGSNFTTYMANNGDFFLGGTGGALTWDASADELVVNGSGTFTGTLSGGSVIGGTLSVPTSTDPKFSVDSDGNMTAQDAVISGSFNIEQGSLGSWVVESPSNGGGFRNQSGSMLFEPERPEIIGKADTGGGLETKLSLHPKNEWASPSGGSVYVSGLDNNNSSNLWTQPANVNTGNNTSIGETSADQNEVATDIVVAQDGTYELTGLYGLSSLTISDPGTVTFSSTYPNYTPTNPIQSHGGNYTGKTSYYYIDLVFRNTSTNAETSANVQTHYRNGAVNISYYQSVAGGNGQYYWQYTSYTQNGSESSTSFAGITKSVTLTAGTYRAKYRIRKGGRSGYTQPKTSSGATGTITYHTHTTGFSNIGYNSGAFTFIQPVNLVELSSKGLQVLSDQNTYVQLTRNATVSNSTEALRVQGAKTVLNAFGTYPSNYNNTALQVGGLISSTGISVGGYNSNSTVYGYMTLGYSPNHGNIRDTIYLKGDFDPAKITWNSTQANTGRDMGSTSFHWDSIYADDFHNQSDERVKENILDSQLGLDFINDIRPVQYSMKESTKKRTRYGFIAQEISSSLDNAGLTTHDFRALSTGSSEITRLERDYEKSITEIIESGSYHSVTNDTGSAIVTQEWVDDKQANTMWNLSYMEFIAPLTKAVQELSAKVTELENRISGSI